jgi:NAD(P)H-nitrite reductase large subunit
MTAEAARLVEPGLAAEGLQVRTLQDVTQVQADASGRVCGVSLDNGQSLPCRLLVVGKGIRPCVEVLQGTGLSLHPGVRVNRFLESEIPGIMAAGDVAQGPDLLDGRPLIVATQLNAIRQGRVAALNILGVPFPDDGGLPANTTHFGGVRVITCGHTGTIQPEEREEIVCREGTYRRYVIRDDRLVGVTLVGDVSNAGRLVSLIQGQVPLRGRLKRVVANTLTGFRRGEVF